MPNDEIFFLTFGQNSPARNGWIEVYAFDYQRARDLVIKAYGKDWSGLYYLEDFETEHFPAGCLGILK